MPNRGPVELNLSEATTLLDELPATRELSEAEDEDDRTRIKLVAKLRPRLEEHRSTLASATDGERFVITMSVDEVDELVDCLAPGELRRRIEAARLAMLDSSAGAAPMPS